MAARDVAVKGVVDQECHAQHAAGAKSKHPQHRDWVADRHAKAAHPWKSGRWLTLLHDGRLVVSGSELRAELRRTPTRELRAECTSPAQRLKMAAVGSLVAPASPSVLDLSSTARALSLQELSVGLPAGSSRRESVGPSAAGLPVPPSPGSVASGASSAALPAPGACPVEVIVLHTRSTVARRAGKGHAPPGARPHAFVIRTGRREHYFAVASADEASRWVEQIGSAIGNVGRYRQLQVGQAELRAALAISSLWRGAKTRRLLKRPQLLEEAREVAAASSLTLATVTRKLATLDAARAELAARGGATSGACTRHRCEVVATGSPPAPPRRTTSPRGARPRGAPVGPAGGAA